MSASLPPGSTGDRRNHSQREFLLDRVAGEFREMPCLRLTRAQAQRLFGLRADVCDRILSTLMTRGTLTRESDDRYRLNDSREGARTFRQSVRPP